MADPRFEKVMTVVFRKESPPLWMPVPENAGYVGHPSYKWNAKGILGNSTTAQPHNPPLVYNATILSRR